MSDPGLSNYTTTALKQMDYDGRVAAAYVAGLERWGKAPEELLDRQRAKVLQGLYAAEELDRRGVPADQRYC